jgi:hypothetical protein
MGIFDGLPHVLDRLVELQARETVLVDKRGEQIETKHIKMV